MALKHYGGTRLATAPWKCPSCQAQNTGPLEGGCVNCGAGSDAKKAEKQTAAPSAPPGIQPEQLHGLPEGMLPGGPAAGVDREAAAFEEWFEWYGREHPPDRKALDLNRAYLVDAFYAGIAWAREQAFAAATEFLEPDPSGGRLLFMDAAPGAVPAPLDDRTHATIVAALTFYRDNHLGYGDLPGQLSAMEVSALLKQLAPEEDA